MELFEKIKFETFWDLYDKKVGALMCKAKWNMLKRSDQEIAINHIELYKAANPNKFFRKDPEKYLDGKCFNDEIIESNPEKRTTQNARLTYNEVLNLFNGVFPVPADKDIWSKLEQVKELDKTYWVYK